jgi:hypothetical protein
MISAGRPDGLLAAHVNVLLRLLARRTVEFKWFGAKDRL